MIWISVALGGALGALGRFAIAQQIKGVAGTLVANGVGCLLMGCLVGFLSTRAPVSEAVRPFLLTGVLGALTTYSTFSLETLQLWQSGRALMAVAYAMGTLLLSLLACALGLWMTRSI